MRKLPAVLLLGSLIVGTCMFFLVRASNMNTLNVNIGRNIVETAKQSGAPRFSVESHWGATFYEIVDLPPDIFVRYIRPGYEISVQPLFALTMYADTENNNDMAVEELTMQFSRHAATTHEDAQLFVDALIVQFRRGSWKRYFEDGCPAITGRSAYLDLEERVKTSCPLDPAYRMSSGDWRALMKWPQRYVWLGDGVIATLSLQYDEDARGLTYSIGLELQDFAIYNRRNAAEEARLLAEGDAKGWHSTGENQKEMAETKVKVRRLEENAMKRGDTVVSRDAKK